MIERLTPEALRVIELAQNDARKSKRAFLGTEQVLIGLIEEDGPVGKALVRHGINYERATAEIMRIIGEEGPGSPAEIPITGQLRKALELAWDESNKLAHHDIGPEHLLLGMLRETEGVSYNVLLNMEIDIKALRTSILDMIAKDRKFPDAETWNNS